jgi:hypothetical protein
LNFELRGRRAAKLIFAENRPTVKRARAAGPFHRPVPPKKICAKPILATSRRDRKKEK